MSLADTFFVIYSLDDGAGFKVSSRLRCQIIAEAREAQRSSSLGNTVDINESTKKLPIEEQFELSLKKLNDNGRLYQAFFANREGALKFIKEAKKYDLDEEAWELYDNISERGLIED